MREGMAGPDSPWYKRTVPLPALNEDELQVLLHGLARIDPSLHLLPDLDSFAHRELMVLTRSLSVVLLEALHTARRS